MSCPLRIQQVTVAVKNIMAKVQAEISFSRKPVAESNFGLVGNNRLLVFVSFETLRFKIGIPNVGI